MSDEEAKQPENIATNESKKPIMRDLTESEAKQLLSRKGAGRRTGVNYLSIIEEFRNSGKPYLDVEIPDVLMDTLYSGLKDTIKRHEIKDVECRGLNRRVVLVRTDLTIPTSS